MHMCEFGRSHLTLHGFAGKNFPPDIMMEVQYLLHHLRKLSRQLSGDGQRLGEIGDEVGRDTNGLPRRIR